MLVYNFLGSEYAIDDLKRRHLKISRLADLNDPFELLTYEMTNTNVQYIDWRSTWELTMEELNKGFGVLCFSQSWSNTLLWSHYGDKHKGICLGFNIDYVQVNIGYTTERLSVSATLDELLYKYANSDPNSISPELEAFMRKPLFTKFKDWDYEDEVRVYAELDDPDIKTGVGFQIKWTDFF